MFVIEPTPRTHRRVRPPYCSWSETLAFLAESRIVASALSGYENVSISRHLGRQLCSGSQRRLGRRPGVFKTDSVHLPEERYRRVFTRVSGTLT